MSNYGYQPGGSYSIHNPKLLKPLFAAKKPWIIPAALLLVILIVLAVNFVPGWIDSLSYGNAEQVTETILPSEEEIDPNPGNGFVAVEVPYPDLYDVQGAFGTIRGDFRTSFRNCTLHSLTYDKAFSDQQQPQLEARYGDVSNDYPEAFLVTGSLTTGEKDVPDGLEPNTTYEGYQWIIGSEANPVILDHGLNLVE